MPREITFDADTTTEDMTKWTERIIQDSQRVQALAKKYRKHTSSEEVLAVLQSMRSVFTQAVATLSQIEDL